MIGPDPLEDAEPAMCSCESGWIVVPPSYAEHMHPLPQQPEVGATAEAMILYQHQTERVLMSRASAMNSVYPCKRCRPAKFERWAGGHLDSGHDLHHCEVCKDAAGTTKRERRSRPRQVEPGYEERPRYPE